MSKDTDGRGWQGAPDRARDLVVDLEGYEGPLDLLLSLARDQKVDLARISVVRLAEQYLAFVAAARHADLQLAAEYLVMAAWLAYLKSRLLLPAAGPLDEPSPQAMAEALAMRLRRLEAMREAGAALMRRPRLGADVFARARPETGDVRIERRAQASLYDLLHAYGRWRRRSQPPPVLDIAPSALDSVEDALVRLRRGVGRTPGWESLSRYLPSVTLEQPCRDRIAARSGFAATFAAALELAREGVLSMRQTAAFGPIYVRARAPAQGAAKGR